ncbi:MAG: hypothetical protein FP814_06585 [Desulfobacterium sp.]|nr:hypothetical protein [Desulfobacterium sp.]MBU3949896.1 hypothetical protein [Pseudomonadota bacterium]MBU4009136.1 hypothetical protein [Pseudomonadota bacterium]MBU4037786.1 hypothetical protein [Pseudomonadota bacterium]
MKSYIFVAVFITVQFLFVTSGLSHGTLSHVTRCVGYLITSEYDDGEPMSYATVEIKSPDSNIAFQTGHTDINGHFMFFPDKQTQWQITITDGMGHRIAVNTDVNADTIDPKPIGTKSQTFFSGMTHAEKIIMGLSIIFGIFGLCYGWKAKREIL